MSLAAKVKSVEALGQWRSSLKHFVGEMWEVLQSAEQKIQRTEDWLQECTSYWRREVERCQEEVWEAKRDLKHCEEDEDNDCSAEEEALFEARRRLHNAEEELRNVRSWKRRVDEMVAAYRVQAERLRCLMSIEMPRADAFLGCVIDDLHKYVTGISLAKQAALTGSASPPVSDALSVKEYTTWKIEDKQLRSAWETLLATEKGRAIAETIRQRGTIVKFGYLPEGYPAAYYPLENEIVVSLDYKDRSANVLAAILAHEGTHVQWYRGEKKPSLEEEYQAYKALAEVWEEVKGKDRDRLCDDWAKIISGGKYAAKMKIIQNSGLDYFRW